MIFVKRSCRTVVVLLIFALCAIYLTSAQTTATSAAEARIEALLRQFDRAYDEGDASDLVGLLAEDAVWMPPGAEPIVGRDAIQARYTAQFASIQSGFTLHASQISVSGNLAWLRGEYERIDTARTGGSSTTITGKYLMTFSRERGDWKITSNTWSPSHPQIDMQIALHSVRALAEVRLHDVAATLKLLADTNQVESGDWATMKPLLTSLGNTGILANAIWFVRPDGYYYTVEKDYTGLNLSQRSYFPGLMAGESVLGTLVISLSTGKRSVIIAEPVFDEARHVIGGLGVSYSVDQLSLEIDAQTRLTNQYVFYALDLAGQTALHRDPTLMFEYPSDMGSPTLSAAVEEMLSEESGSVTYVFRGLRKTVLFERSASLGWVFALGFGEPAIANVL